MAWMRTFTFNGIRSDTYFLTRAIHREILPPVAVQTLTVPNRPGAYPVSSTLGVRTIEVNVSLLRTSAEVLRSDVRKIAAWLFRNEDKMLTFSDEPDKYYLARVQGNSDLADNLAAGETTITFLCSDPFAYANTEQSQSLSLTANNTVVNAGTYETFPRIRITTTAALSYVKVTLGSKILLVNGPFAAGEVFWIDCLQNLVYRDSDKARLMTRVDLASDFFSLAVGNNSVKLEPTTGYAAVMYFRERWL